jgi:hypothetical protein
MSKVGSSTTHIQYHARIVEFPSRKTGAFISYPSSVLEKKNKLPIQAWKSCVVGIQFRKLQVSVDSNTHQSYKMQNPAAGSCVPASPGSAKPSIILVQRIRGILNLHTQQKPSARQKWLHWHRGITLPDGPHASGQFELGSHSCVRDVLAVCIAEAPNRGGVQGGNQGGVRDAQRCTALRGSRRPRLRSVHAHGHESDVHAHG